MIIRLSLLLTLAAFLLFLLVELLLHLAVPGLPALLTLLASAMLLGAFCVLIIAGLAGVATATVGAIADYFSAKRRAQRRLWFAQGRHEQLRRLFYFKKMQVKYSHERSRQCLLARNNRKHIRSLSQAIDHDLLSIKNKLPETAYQQLQQDHARHRNQQNIEALLSLQQRISSLGGA
ncbi:MAG: hypothetical protein ACNA7G_01720 [Methylobacter sp.]